MTYRVIQWGTGATGKGAVQGILAHPELELVGAWVHSEAKDGRDVGEICGLPPAGVTATRDKAALLAMDADCVSFMPARTWSRDGAEVFADLLAILRSGKNVANLWWPGLLNPKTLGEEVHQQLKDACREGGSSIYTGGMNPGYGSLGLMLMGFDLSSSVDAVRCMEYYNYAYWADQMAQMFGFGQPTAEGIPILQPGVPTSMYAAPLYLMAEAMGVEIEEVVEEHEVLWADERFEIPSGPIEKGTVSGLALLVKGMAGGVSRVEVGSVARLRDGDFADKGFVGNGYRAEILGEPVMKIDVQISSPPGAENDDHGTGVATAMTVVNVIPQICEAPPGVLRILDFVRPARLFGRA